MPQPETRNPEPETRNPTLEPQNPKPETRNPTPEIQNPTLGTRNPKPKPETLLALRGHCGIVPRTFPGMWCISELNRAGSFQKTFIASCEMGDSGFITCLKGGAPPRPITCDRWHPPTPPCLIRPCEMGGGCSTVPHNLLNIRCERGP
ncbi:hypothetical protein T484DRAFT_1643692 [Baffinella frigidus]|nr:hypothetical protein T484DRAFT_1643692 [Cryptophyta sp. CCMP2293]